jgi:heat shock protein HslJ
MISSQESGLISEMERSPSKGVTIRNQYSVDDGTFSVDSFWLTTFMNCPQDADSNLQNLFDNSRTFELNGKELIFKNEKGDTLLSLEAIE